MYCSIQDVINRLSQNELALLSSDSGNDINDDIVNIAINDASDIIDSYLKKAYELPLAYTPNIINKIATELTIIFLNDKNNQYDESIENKRKIYFNLLEKIANKDIILNIQSQNSPEYDKILFSSKKRLFKRDTI